jgi:hypothetical protein
MFLFFLPACLTHRGPLPVALALAPQSHNPYGFRTRDVLRTVKADARDLAAQLLANGRELEGAPLLIRLDLLKDIVPMVRDPAAAAAARRLGCCAEDCLCVRRACDRLLWTLPRSMHHRTSEHTLASQSRMTRRRHRDCLSEAMTKVQGLFI